VRQPTSIVGALLALLAVPSSWWLVQLSSLLGRAAGKQRPFRNEQRCQALSRAEFARPPENHWIGFIFNPSRRKLSVPSYPRSLLHYPTAAPLPRYTFFLRLKWRKPYIAHCYTLT